MGDVRVLLSWLYLIGIDVLVGVGVVDLEVRFWLKSQMEITWNKGDKVMEGERGMTHSVRRS